MRALRRFSMVFRVRGGLADVVEVVVGDVEEEAHRDAEPE